MQCVLTYIHRDRVTVGLVSVSLLSLEAQVQFQGVVRAICSGKVALELCFLCELRVSVANYNYTSALYSSTFRAWSNWLIWGLSIYEINFIPLVQLHIYICTDLYGIFIIGSCILLRVILNHK
jgi:hypothetical protein